jgi:hypothetical protein
VVVNIKHLAFYDFPGSLQRCAAGSDIKKGSTYKNIKNSAFYDFPGSLQRCAAGSDIKKGSTYKKIKHLDFMVSQGPCSATLPAAI